MDPYSGQLYPDIDTAKAAGVRNPVEITGLREDVERISEAVALNRRIEDHQNEAAVARRRAANKAARKARRHNR